MAPARYQPASRRCSLARQRSAARSLASPTRCVIAFRLRQIDGAVVVLQGFGELASYASRFGLEQGFVLPEIVRAVGWQRHASAQGSAAAFCGAVRRRASGPVSATAAANPR